MREQCTAPEEWRAVVGFEDWYEVSDHGRVRRIKAGPRTYAGRLLNPQRLIAPPGYWGVRLWNGTGRGVTKKIHLLMADAFMPQKPSPLHEINHRDLNSWNNLLTNLEWMLHKENIRHAFRGGAVGDRHGAKNANARLTEADVREIRKADLPHLILAEEYGVSVSTIAKIRQRRIWTHLD